MTVDVFFFHRLGRAFSSRPVRPTHLLYCFENRIGSVVGVPFIPSPARFAPLFTVFVLVILLVCSLSLLSIIGWTFTAYPLPP